MPAMSATFDIKKSRNLITKTARRRLSEDKVLARRRVRARLKASDIQTNWNGSFRPALTKLDIT